MKRNKTPTTTMTIRLPVDVKDALTILADKFAMTPSALASQLLCLGLSIGDRIEEETKASEAR